MDGLSEAEFYAQQLLGAEALLESEACGLPVSVQVDRLEEALSARFGHATAAVYEVELDQLLGTQRAVAFDAVVVGLASPFVLVDDEMVCTGSVDVAAVIEAIESQRAADPAST